VSRGLTAPAAERNKDPILDVLRRVLPPRGVVLEVASGTGQHAVHMAVALPGLVWQPSDPDPDARASISAWIEETGAANVLPPLALDVRSVPWPIAEADAVVCINMIHIAPWTAAEHLVAGAGRILGPGAPLVLYGPYRRNGRHTAASNDAFDADLRRRNPDWGVRDLEAVAALAAENGLALDEVVEMPANNLTVVLRRAPG
jgi:SAM-dependent methyltransferase